MNTTDADRLSPHEADDLDVILLGHSLGGILAADVALLQAEGQMRLKHRILGVVNFDVPFLGLHPRVIPTGICGSIPKKDIPAEGELAAEQESLGLDPANKPVPPSPNFDPPFKNDVRQVQRGFFKGMMHFVNKNADNLSRSIFDRIISPVKFANCVNNYSELRRRYRRLVELENAEYSPERVRLVNYYTASTGRPKTKAKPSNETEDMDQTEGTTTPRPPDCSEMPEISKEAEEDTTTSNLPEGSSESTLVTEQGCPEKDNPLVDTRRASSTTDQKEDSQSISGSVSVSISPSESDPNSDPSKRKLRTFILLPSHHWKYNNNAHWTPIVMEDMDEVTAHQSMFVPHGANYEHLVGDVVALIEQWVQSDLSRQLLRESLD